MKQSQQRTVGGAERAGLQLSLAHDPKSPAVLVLDGYGLSVSVSRGHLLLCDGLGRHRRERRLSRAQRQVSRIVILGLTGHISLEAVRWCRDVGVALAQLDTNGSVLLVAGANSGRDDARLRRSQAAASGTATGVKIARQLLTPKLNGQAKNLDGNDLDAASAEAIRAMAAQLPRASDLPGIVELEAAAANLYFSAWTSHVGCVFAACDAERFPDHWARFNARSSPLSSTTYSARHAGDPVNALLNYGYALAEFEATLALRAVGLDPGLGIVHTDRPNRDSLALDLMEAIRPTVDYLVLGLLQARAFNRHDLFETRTGQCRLLAPMTHELAGWLPYLASQVAPHASRLGNTLAGASPTAIALTSPLSRTQRTRARRPSAMPRTATSRQQPPRPTATCRQCGAALSVKRRQFCPTCWPLAQRHLTRNATHAGSQKLEQLRAAGRVPNLQPDAVAKKARSLSTRKREELAWTPSVEEAAWTSDMYRAEIWSGLRELPISRLKDATGLSHSACSRIRSGSLLPHRRHWMTLLALVPQS